LFSRGVQGVVTGVASQLTRIAIEGGKLNWSAVAADGLGAVVAAVGRRQPTSAQTLSGKSDDEILQWIANQKPRIDPSLGVKVASSGELPTVVIEAPRLSPDDLSPEERAQLAAEDISYYAAGERVRALMDSGRPLWPTLDTLSRSPNISNTQFAAAQRAQAHPSAISGNRYVPRASLSAWNGVMRDAPAMAYLKSTGALDVRSGSFEMQVGKELPEALATVGTPHLIPARVAGLFSRGLVATQRTILGERSVLMSQMRGELRAGLQANLAATTSLTPEARYALAPSVAAKGGIRVTNSTGTTSVIAPEKFKYIFGEVDSSAHNLARSEQLLTQMKRLGVSNTAEGRAILTEHFEVVARTEGNVARTFTNQYGNFEVRESLFVGPSGQAAKFETTFRLAPDGTRQFSTVIPKGGLPHNGYEHSPKEF
jgi:hypothetical protein